MNSNWTEQITTWPGSYPGLSGTIYLDSDYNLKIKKVSNGFILKDGTIEYVFVSMESLTTFLANKFKEDK